MFLSIDKFIFITYSSLHLPVPNGFMSHNAPTHYVAGMCNGYFFSFISFLSLYDQ